MRLLLALTIGFTVFLLSGAARADTRKFPGFVKYSNVTLKWGYASDNSLYQWHNGQPKGSSKTRAIWRNR